MSVSKPRVAARWSPCPQPISRSPNFAPPRRAVNAHSHIFGPYGTFALAPSARFEPPEAPIEQLLQTDDVLGFSRTVLVESGVDQGHQTLLDALDRYPTRTRGVALVDLKTSDAEIALLAERGVRGARVNFMPHLNREVRWDDIRTLVDSFAHVGWHLQVHLHGDAIVEHAASLRRLPCAVVVDHMARVDLSQGPNSQAIRTLKGLIDTGHVWVKVSGADRLSLSGPPYADAVALAAGLVSYAPTRILWGTDWPHVNILGPPPDDADLVDLIEQIAPDARDRMLMLVSNPSELYGFEVNEGEEHETG